MNDRQRIGFGLSGATSSVIVGLLLLKYGFNFVTTSLLVLVLVALVFFLRARIRDERRTDRPYRQPS